MKDKEFVVEKIRSQYVDILQGEISVQSTPNQGSTFTVKIRRNG